jgi:hypothetical protein
VHLPLLCIYALFFTDESEEVIPPSKSRRSSTSTTPSGRRAGKAPIGEGSTTAGPRVKIPTRRGNTRNVEIEEEDEISPNIIMAYNLKKCPLSV